MKFCTNCGNAADNNDIVCTQCGTRLEGCVPDDSGFNPPVVNSNAAQKYLVVTILGVVAALSFLFLPLITISFWGQTESISFFKLWLEVGDLGFEGFILLVLAVGGGIATAIGGGTKKKMVALGGTVAGVCGILYFIIRMGSEMPIMEYLGAGAWIALIALIAYIAGIVISVIADK